jgi:hypothetical protein
MGFSVDQLIVKSLKEGGIYWNSRIKLIARHVSLQAVEKLPGFGTIFKVCDKVDSGNQYAAFACLCFKNECKRTVGKPVVDYPNYWL